MKKLLHHPFLVLSLLFVCSLASCKHEEQQITRMLDSKLKSTFNFKPGTYWIFGDTITGRIDSFYVKNYLQSVKRYDNTNYENIEIEIRQHNIFPGDSNDSWHTLILELQRTSQIALRYTWGYDSFKTYHYPAVTYPFKLGQHIGNETRGSDNRVPDTINITTMEVVNVNNQSFNDVTVLRISNRYTFFNFRFEYNDLFYLNADKGFIKISMNHNADSYFKRWELIREKIIR